MSTNHYSSSVPNAADVSDGANITDPTHYPRQMVTSVNMHNQADNAESGILILNINASDIAICHRYCVGNLCDYSALAFKLNPKLNREFVNNIFRPFKVHQARLAIFITRQTGTRI